jgi:hypothetical protein
MMAVKSVIVHFFAVLHLPAVCEILVFHLLSISTHHPYQTAIQIIELYVCIIRCLDRRGKSDSEGMENDISQFIPHFMNAVEIFSSKNVPVTDLQFVGCLYMLPRCG